MSLNRIELDCSPEDVFAVLSDGWCYATWVVGASRIRSVDTAWPAEGARIHHSVGVWPALLDDTTSSIECDPPHRLALTVRAWPTGEGRVIISCTDLGGTTEVTMEEYPTKGPARLVPAPVTDRMLHWRNSEALRRLGYLAERKARD